MSIGIDSVLGMLEQLLKYYTQYAEYMLGLTLTPVVYVTPYIWKGCKHIYINYPYVFWGTMIAMFWFGHISRTIHVVRPILQRYVLLLVRWYFMLLTWPLWIWWLTPLRAWQKHKAKQEAEANGFYPSDQE